MTRSKTGAQGVQPGVTTSDLLDKELGKDKVKDVLGDYLDEAETAVKDLIRAHSRLTRSE